jgi:hypothetical protein
MSYERVGVAPPCLPSSPPARGGLGGSGATTSGLPLQDFTIHLDALYQDRGGAGLLDFLLLVKILAK